MEKERNDVPASKWHQIWPSAALALAGGLTACWAILLFWGMIRVMAAAFD